MKKKYYYHSLRYPTFQIGEVSAGSIVFFESDDIVIKINDVVTSYTRDGSHYTIRPTSSTFTITVELTGYEVYSAEYNRQSLDGGIILLDREVSYGRITFYSLWEKTISPKDWDSHLMVYYAGARVKELEYHNVNEYFYIKDGAVLTVAEEATSTYDESIDCDIAINLDVDDTGDDNGEHTLIIIKNQGKFNLYTFYYEQYGFDTEKTKGPKDYEMTIAVTGLQRETMIITPPNDVGLFYKVLTFNGSNITTVNQVVNTNPTDQWKVIEGLNNG